MLVLVLSQKVFSETLVSGATSREILLTQVLFSDRFRLIATDFIWELLLYIIVTLKITPQFPARNCCRYLVGHTMIFDVTVVYERSSLFNVCSNSLLKSAVIKQNRLENKT